MQFMKTFSGDCLLKRMCSADYEYAMESGCLSLKCNVREKDDEEEEEEDHILPYLGVSEIKDKGELIRAFLAEFVGTLFLVLVGCGSCMGGDDSEASIQLDDQANIVRISLCFGITVADIVRISFCFGITVATLAQTLGHVSGCHINPAVTLGLVVGGKIGVIKGALYVAVQCVGAILGAVILYAVVPAEARGATGLGKTGLGPNVTLVQAVTIEMLITMVLVMVVFAAAADGINAATVKGSAPLAIGLSITTCHLFAVPLTGSSMNPARSLGPAVVLGQFENHWVYWVGPLLGGFLAAVFYQMVLKASMEEKKEGRRVRKVSSIRNQRIREEESPPYQKSPVVGIRSNLITQEE